MLTLYITAALTGITCTSPSVTDAWLADSSMLVIGGVESTYADQWCIWMYDMNTWDHKNYQTETETALKRRNRDDIV